MPPYMVLVLSRSGEPIFSDTTAHYVLQHNGVSQKPQPGFYVMEKLQEADNGIVW